MKWKNKRTVKHMIYDDYFEYSDEFEKQIANFKSELTKTIKEEHQKEMESLRKENIRLSAIEDEMIETIKKCNKQLFDMRIKKNNLKSEVEAEFYKSNIEDIFQRYIDNSVVWYAASISHDQPKCELCNEERKQVAKFPNGKEVYNSCDCARKFTVYEPKISEIRRIRFYKKDSKYHGSRSFYFNQEYKLNNNDSRDYDLYEFNIQHIIETFDEETKKVHANKNYLDLISFSSEEECQKYCDWLNEKEPRNKEIPIPAEF